MFEFLDTPIPGCYEIQPRIFDDLRGRFVKTFHHVMFAEKGLNTNWPEEYYSTSQKNVLRGMHFQLPPHAHEKLVYCTVGEVLDVVVDLRKGSPTYGQHARFRLSAAAANMLYVPRGLAHGFLTITDSATMMYKVATIYAPEHDTGLLWNSFGIDWPLTAPIISERDASFITLADFDNPFTFDAQFNE